MQYISVFKCQKPLCLAYQSHLFHPEECVGSNRSEDAAFLWSCGRKPWVPSLTWMLIVLHSQVPKNPNGAVMVCVFLPLFNLDWVFHLQAALTAGCLIVWVRLVCTCVCMPACVSVIIRLLFHISRTFLCRMLQFQCDVQTLQCMITWTNIYCFFNHVYIFQSVPVYVCVVHQATHSCTKPLAWLLMMTYEFLALVMAVKSHNYTLLYCNA